MTNDDLNQIKARAASQGLTLATLCDMVLGEDAPDRSDAALVRAVGLLVRRCEANDYAASMASLNAAVNDITRGDA